MAGRPLSPAIRLRLGGPLPRLLADRTRVPLLPDCSFHLSAYAVLASVSKCCPPAGDRSSRVTHPSATWLYSKQASYITPFDLHVLGTPPAFVLSQDQTLRLIPVSLQLYPLLQNEPVARSSCTSVLYTFSTSASAPLASALSRPALRSFRFRLAPLYSLVMVQRRSLSGPPRGFPQNRLPAAQRERVYYASSVSSTTFFNFFRRTPGSVCA